MDGGERDRGERGEEGNRKKERGEGKGKEKERREETVAPCFILLDGCLGFESTPKFPTCVLLERAGVLEFHNGEQCEPSGPVGWLSGQCHKSPREGKWEEGVRGKEGERERRGRRGSRERREMRERRKRRERGEMRERGRGRRKGNGERK